MALLDAGDIVIIIAIIVIIIVVIVIIILVVMIIMVVIMVIVISLVNNQHHEPNYQTESKLESTITGIKIFIVVLTMDQIPRKRIRVNKETNI